MICSFLPSRTRALGWGMLLLQMRVDGYDSLSAARFWSTSVVDTSDMSPPKAGIAGILDLHIPKTGGSSLDEELFASMMNSSHDLCMLKCFANYSNRVEWINGKVCNWTAPAVITGHVSFNIAEAAAIMKTPRVFSLTFVRDPLSRVVSYANFINLPYDTFVTVMWQHLATNVQTMMLNGVPNASPRTSPHLIKSPVRGMCQFDPAEAIASARRQLVDVITVFGITERYVESLWLFKKTFGWDTEMVERPLLQAHKAFCGYSVDPAKCGKHRYTVDDIGPDIRVAIRNTEVCDYAVYEAALDVFHARIEAGDQEDLANFKSVVHRAEYEEQGAK